MNTSSQYWQANLRLVYGCLLMWAFVSYGCGILMVDLLNQIHIGGYQLGFWFSQQGAIYSFVLLTFFYAWRVNKLDHKFNVHED